MALIFSPDPMPVDVINALPALPLAVDELPVDPIAELIDSWPRAFVAQVIGNTSRDLSKPRTNLVGAQAWLSMMAPESPTLRARAGNSEAKNSPITSPDAGFICWMSLPLDDGSTRN
jgi:hypothetical protein